MFQKVFRKKNLRGEDGGKYQTDNNGSVQLTRKYTSNHLFQA